uniref:Uncharacterized protein n=4 Tax=Oryza TaxID=4527 RepID=Q53LZ0_ORYSJ|nr:hypothetical protein LOC_Os11g16440 [Oryza sativa Japonica Group]AAX96319.1 hypothetical protein [Oryza sativa Japonica Group]ABA92502.1 hypothetical protein LOC_Os11g16440 [Oryza sativa Japonica Group]
MGLVPKLEKIMWTFTGMNSSFSGIDNIMQPSEILKELEFNGESLPNQVKEAIDKHKDKIHYTYYKWEIHEKTQGNAEANYTNMEALLKISRLHHHDTREGKKYSAVLLFAFLVLISADGNQICCP